jgi:hypothetical protein
MFKFYRKLTRANTTVPFEPMELDDDKRHFFINYLKTNKFLSKEEDKLSDDGLVIEKVSIWRSFDDFIDFRVDPIGERAGIRAMNHYLENNIIVETRELND